MRAFVRSYIQSEKQRRDENGDAGFSLIELIVVVVILGILAAVAIPVFLNLQSNAETSARETVAANAASQFAADLANDPDYAFDAANFTSLTAGTDYAITSTGASTLGGFCITVTEDADTAKVADSGPGC